MQPDRSTIFLNKLMIDDMYNVNYYNYPQLINIQVTQSIDFTSDYLINNLKPYNLNAIQPTLSCNLLSVVDILNLSPTIVLQFHKKKLRSDIE